MTSTTTTSASLAGTRPTSTRPSSTRPTSTVVGTVTLTRFMLRRERFRIVVWSLGGAALTAIQSVQSQNTYSDPGDLAVYAATSGNTAAIIAMSGPPVGLDTVAGGIAFELLGWLCLLTALMVLFLVVRHTRSEEESGRAELIRAGHVGRHAPMLATALTAAVCCGAIALGVLAAALATGLALSGSLLLACAVAGAGLSFTGVSLVAAQVLSSGRGALGLAGGVLAVSYLVRAVGDVNGDGLSWLSPIGWAQGTHPFTREQGWPLLLPLVAVGACGWAAARLLDARDFGAGLVAGRAGAPCASAALGSPVGLAWRVLRSTFIGWSVGVVVAGFAYASITNSVETFTEQNPQIAEMLPGGAAGIVDGYLAVCVTITALLCAIYVVSAVLRAGAEEGAGRAELVLATATSRSAWLGGHVLVAVAGGVVMLAASGLAIGTSYALTGGSLSRIAPLTASSLAYAPALLVMAGAATLGLGWSRRVKALAWVALGYVGLSAFFARSLQLPDWFALASPFHHTPELPAEEWAWPPLAGLLAVGALLTLLGLLLLRRRDIG